MRQEADGSGRPLPGGLFDAPAYGLGQRQFKGAQVIGAAKLRDVAVFVGPQPATREYAIDFIEIQIELGHPVFELMRVRHQAAMAHHAFVHCARRLRIRAALIDVHAAISRTGESAAGTDALPAGRRTPIAAATSTALRMPSS